MVKAKVIILQKDFDGLPKDEDFKLIEEELPPLQDGEFLAEAVYLSVDPCFRAYSFFREVGSVFMGSQVAKITESKTEKYPVGKFVVGNFGWRTHTIARDSPLIIDVMILPDFGKLPVSLGLGMLGMPGNTAYFGFLKLCKPRAGQTVVVSGAAGAVGSHVGQIAKIKGCKVIGITGSNAKGKWLVEELGFDHFVNYKEPNLKQQLEAFVSGGIDCYFDNVGGEISTTIYGLMKPFGRVAVCGAISCYNHDKSNLPKVTITQNLIVWKELTIQGFVVFRWLDIWEKGIYQNLKWINEGKLKIKETVIEGFENSPKAFIGMLRGINIGKTIVKV